MKKYKNRIVENPTNAIIIVVSIVAFVIGIIAVGFWISLICIAGLNILCFWKELKEALRKIKRKDNKEKKLDEQIYEFKKGNKIVTVKDNDMKKEKKQKKERKEKKKLTWLVRVGQVFLILACIGFISAIGFGIWFAAYIVKNAPEFIPENLYSSEPSEIYYSNGELMATIGTENRIIVSYDELPEVMINALLAVEDAKFFQHNGVDIQRFLWASIQQVFGNSDAGGASTLTMQLSKNYVQGSLVATGWEGIVRKFTDVYLSVFHIEPTYTKEEIIEFYVNSSQLGHAYGVEAAARTYFHKSARDLNVSEAALLAGMYQAPSRLDPFINPDNAEARRKTALNLMLRHGYINKAEYDVAIKMTVDKIVKPRDSVRQTTDELDARTRSAVDTIIEEVMDKTGKDPNNISMKIYTTIDKKLQLHVGGIMLGQNSGYKWENGKVEGGVAVVDIKTGALVAVGGNRSAEAFTLNHATDISYQIGSTAKPLYDYGPAFEYLNWSTGTLLSDESYSYSNGKSVSNWDNKYDGVNTARSHIVRSRNIPALKTFQSVNASDINKFVRSLGLSPESPLHEAHSIGGYNGESPLSMASAFAAFGNGGYYTAPYTVNKIVYVTTGETYVNKAATSQVMSSSTAYMITNILQDTASAGLGMGQYNSVPGVKYAVKTGTTNFDSETTKKNKLPGSAVRDLWTVGYNTEYAIGVWYGYDSVKDGYNKLGSSQGARLFNAVARVAFTNKSDFKMPDTVVKVEIEKDNATLMLPSPYTPASYKRKELFVKGTEPTTVSTRFSKLADVTNLTASSGYGVLTLSWNAIAEPDAFNFALLFSQNKSAFAKDSSLTNYVNGIIKTNRSVLGTVGYNIYVETAEGLQLLGWTADTYYNITEYPGTNTYVVKTAYSNFKANMSDGRKVTGSTY